MQKLLLLLLLIPAIAQAQVSLYYTVSGNLYVPEKVRLTGYGPQASINAIVTDHLDLGASLSAIKLSFFKKLYIPVSAKISLFPFQSEPGIIPFITLEPGYGLYSDTEQQTDNSQLKVKGGFTFTGSIGAKPRSEKRVAPFVAAGFWHGGYKEYASMPPNSEWNKKNIYSMNRLVVKVGLFL